METNARFAFVGAATLIGLGLIMVFSAWLIGSDWRVGRHIFDVVFPGPVRGLNEGSEVRFNGIKVGEVKSLRIDDNNPANIVARIEVRATTPLRGDSTAQLEAVGLTGVTLIQLAAGSPDAPPLRPRLGEAPPRIQARPGVIDELLTPQNARMLANALANLEIISGRLAREDSIVVESTRTAREIAAAARAVSGASRALENQVILTGGEARLAAKRAAEAFAAMDAAALSVTEAAPRLTRAADSLSTTSSAVEQTLDNPSSLLRGRRLPAVPVAP